MFDISSPAAFIPAIFLTLVAALAAFLAKEARTSRKYPVENLPYFNEINLSIGYIRRNILQSGRFRYRQNIDCNLKYDNKIYNSLRHAGVLYAMYLYETSGYTDVGKTDRYRAAEYFIKKYIKKFGEKRYIVISLPQEEQLNMPVAKTGAAGIALCALTNLHQDKKISLNILRGLGEFLISMQAPDGRMYAYFDLKAKKTDKEAEAVFYTGEAAMGLLYLYEIDPDERWLLAAKKAVLYSAKNGKDFDVDVPFDNWSLAAIEKMLKKGYIQEEEKGILLSYVERTIISAISKQITDKKNSYFGAFEENLRPASIGTIMEGLASGYFCTDNEDIRNLIYKSLAIGCLFLNKVQVKTGRQAGGIPNSANWVRAGVSPNASVIRIDNVWHVVFAWLKFQEIIKIKNPQNE